MTVEVRPATVNDARAVATVHVAAWRKAYDGLLPEDMLAGQSVDTRTELWTALIADPGGVSVAVVGGEIAGFTSIGPNRDEDLPDEIGELYAIYLDPTRWSTGAGHALHEVAITDLRAAGYSSASLWVLDGNERAIGFYERHGWTADGTVKDDVRETVILHERRFVRDLPG